jgi:predicted GNAT family acetyltransferase
LIFESEEASFGDWFTDLAHKIRRGCADITTKRVDGRTVACAACVAKTDTAALIGFVKTAADYRRRGYGAELVKSLCAFLQSGGRQVFLCREENKNEKFYSQIGFADCGEWMTAKNG